MIDATEGQGAALPARKRKSKIIGRPPAEIDLKHFRKMCMYQFTVEELAAALKLSKRTLLKKIKQPEYLEAWEQGLADGRVRVKRRGFELMEIKGSAGVQAWIHMTKHVLGWTDKSAIELSHSGRVDSNIEVSSAGERVAAKLNALRERIDRRVAGIAADAGATTIPREPVGS
jgi:hypothetical protein